MMKHDATLGFFHSVPFPAREAGAAAEPQSPIKPFTESILRFWDVLQAAKPAGQGKQAPAMMGMDENAAAERAQFDFAVKVNLGLHWLRLIESGDKHAIAVKDRLEEAANQTDYERVSFAFDGAAKAEIARAHVLGKLILNNRKHPAFRILLRRLGCRIYL